MKINFIYVLYDILYKYLLYFITCQPNGIFFQNNAIAGVPMPGPYYIHNYFSNPDPKLYVINYLSFG